eukprot:snap_masked-scaffold_23-processed-gene-5.38-mRNA-1 protein AED:1.00 eAED:1.00 QI:0/0/0/0/1/1/2/0/79
MFKERGSKDSRSSCRYYEQNFRQDDTNQKQKLEETKRIGFKVQDYIFIKKVWGLKIKILHFQEKGMGFKDQVAGIGLKM